MGKKKNKKNVNMDMNESYDSQEFPVEYPPKFDRDYLSMIDDDTLYNIGKTLSDSISRVERMNLNSYPWEVESCYVQQEMQMRSLRRAAHQTWMSARRELNLDDSESSVEDFGSENN